MKNSSAASKPGLRERKKQQTRQLIFETASRLFRERGFDVVTVAEVARAADVSDLTVFNYFPTKADLYFGRMEFFEERLLAAVAERPDGEPALNPFRRLIIDGAAEFSDVNAERIARVAPAIAASPVLKIHEREVVARYARQLAELLARETDAQPGDPVPTAVATALFGAHRAVVEYVRGEVLAGHRGPALAARVQAQATRVFAVLEAGMADYPPKRRRSSRRHS
jgi:AcrR family transcriptional regulator